MSLSITGKLKDIQTDKVIGVKVVGSYLFEAALSLERAKEMKVPDIEYVQYLDCAEHEVCVSPTGKYAMLEKEAGYHAELKDEPFTNFMGMYSIWGHLFQPYDLLGLDDSYAIYRMLNGEL